MRVSKKKKCPLASRLRQTTRTVVSSSSTRDRRHAKSELVIMRVPEKKGKNEKKKMEKGKNTLTDLEIDGQEDGSC